MHVISTCCSWFVAAVDLANFFKAKHPIPSCMHFRDVRQTFMRLVRLAFYFCNTFSYDFLSAVSYNQVCLCERRERKKTSLSLLLFFFLFLSTVCWNITKLHYSSCYRETLLVQLVCFITSFWSFQLPTLTMSGTTVITQINLCIFLFFYQIFWMLLALL